MPMKTNGDLPAAPLLLDTKPTLSGGTTADDYFEGLTKREMMAMAAMQGLLTNSSGGYSDYKYMAQDAVTAADALLAELERKNE